MNNRISLPVLIVLATVAQSSAQDDPKDEAKELRWLGHLNAKTSWNILTTTGMVRIDGTFGGISNDTFFIRGDDDIDHQVPVGALMDPEQKYLYAFENRTGLSLPGAHTRRLRSNSAYSEYVYDNDTRRRDALALRREYNMSKGPARGRTAVVLPVDITGPAVGLKSGTMMWQPPIPRPRRWRLW